ncbi:unnamed protein product, partial [Prunus brigantina]
ANSVGIVPGTEASFMFSGRLTLLLTLWPRWGMRWKWVFTALFCLLVVLSVFSRKTGMAF